VFCPECGEEVAENNKFCGNCGHKLVEKENQLTISSKVDAEMDRLDQKNYSPKKSSSNWNWPAFLFGPFWYLYKGMVKNAILIFIIGTIVGYLIPVIGPLAVWLYCGFKANDDLEKHLAKKYN